MIVDAHSHIFPDNIAKHALSKLQAGSNAGIFCEATENALTASMAQAGIDLCINLPCGTNPAKVRQINQLSARRNSRQKKIFSIGCIHPDCADVKAELALAARLGLKAVKLHPYFQNHDFDDPAYLRLMEAAGELGLLVVAHTGTDLGYPGVYRCTTPMIANVLKQVRGVKLVLAHMGGCGNWEDVLEVVADSDVMLDCAYSLGCTLDMEGKPMAGMPDLLTAEQFMAMEKVLGPERILFGTDSPWMDQKNTLELFLSLPLSPEARERILWKNAMELYDLQPWLDGEAK
ncbi:MAG: amidohydrolase family protein [Candidatus Limivicinus sp.]